MRILAIETSCDDTCVAILEIGPPSGEWKLKILSNVVSSQVKLHAKYGGVYPSLAKREHQKNLPIVLKKVLKETGSPKINLIAVTVGPGLEPCLWTGVNFAKDLAQKMNLPILPVNHIEAHLAANFIGGKSKTEFPFMKTRRKKRTKLSPLIQNPKSKKILPAVCLVVSGGHTQLILMKSIGKYRIIGETRDDAAGECFDKTARILNLGYPGGPAIAAAAAKFQNSNNSTYVDLLLLPRPMIYQKNYDFSFSGLKTAVLYDFKKRSPKTRKSKQYIRAMAAEIQRAIIDVLIHKTLKAAKDYKAKSIILAGGVAANKELKKQFAKIIKKELPNIQYLIPNIQFCTDNAVMAAAAGYFNWLKRGIKNYQGIKANANLRI